MIAQKHKTKAT